VVVTRWFGGIKLGAGGLVRAYGGCAAECLRIAAKRELIAQVAIRVECDFASAGALHTRLDEYAAVKNGTIASRERVFEPPKQTSPDNSGQIVDSTGNGVAVAFAWQDTGEPAASYYLQIAKSPYFASDTVLVDRGGLASRDFRMGGLIPGTYYWRLRATSKSGQTTNWNDPWRFTVVKGGSGRSIDVADWRVESIGGSLYFVSGRTQAGVKVRSQGRETIAASDGTFKLQILSRSSVAAIEIADDFGNHSGYILALSTATVTRRY